MIMKTWCFLFAFVHVTYCAVIFKSTPEPDLSSTCLECEAYVKMKDAIWTNESSISVITKKLDAECKNEESIAKKKICTALVDVFVQIPGSIFEGMDSLAWPIPTATCATVHKCKVNCCAADAKPEQVHLSLDATDRSIMGVSWVTLNQTESIVEYGTNQEELDSKMTGDVSTYTAAGWVGTIHKAAMKNLNPSTKYYYRVGSDVDNSWSEIFSFTTFASEKDQESTSEGLTFAMIGDMDYGPMSDPTVAQLQKLTEDNSIQCVVHTGDISYADGYEPHWDVFMNKIEPIASKIPYMVVPGNHEFWYNFTAYKSRFYMPGVLSTDGTDATFNGSGDNMFYSWNLGGVHFISMNSETAIDLANFADNEIAWLEKDLQAVDRSVTPWLIVNFHRPMYCTGDSDCDKPAARLRSEAEDLFMKYRVNLVITAHVHAYERTYPVYNNTKMSESYDQYTGPVYILQGASGNREGNKGSYPDEMPVWSAAHSTEVGYGLMKVTHDLLQWHFYNSSDGAQLDYFEIKV